MLPSDAQDVAWQWMGRSMFNVVDFRQNQSCRPASLPPRKPAYIDIAELKSRAAYLQSKAIEDIHGSILMLDLAAQQARLLAENTSNPAMRHSFIVHISIIEQLLLFARDMTGRL